MAQPQPKPEIPGYQLVKQIGSGGMATVFLAVQLSLERRVAIKVLRTVADDDPDRTEKRFLREGRTLAKITHKNVCGIYDIAKVGNIAYIAMEYLDGGTLVDKLRQGVSVSEAISTVVQIASALEEAHKLGIIHRDLKPANVMLRAGRIPVLTDFGIARELTSSHTRITAENMIVGTPIYMSPEQVSGGEVDGRSDLYALGIMFYELLTGQPPYRGDTPIAVCMQHLTAALPTLPEDLADLQPVLDRMLAKKREDRYADMLVFTHALRDVFVGSEALRHVLRFSPDMPWSEQLRDLGFSFDTLRDADVKAALEAQRGRLAPATGKHARGKSPPPQPKPRMAYSEPLDDEPVSAPPRRGPPRAMITAIAVLVLLVGAAGIWWWQKPKVISESEQMTLALLYNEFGERLADGKLFEPATNSALHFANQMRRIAPGSEETKLALQQLAAAAVERAELSLQGGDNAGFEAAVAALRQAIPDSPELAALMAKRDAEDARLGAELALRKRLARLAELTAGAAPAAGESVLGLYLDLRGPLNKDEQFKKLEPKALKAARARVDKALVDGDRLSALADARALSSVQPQDASLAALVRDLEKQVNQEQQAAAATLKAENEAKQRGMLAIGAAPWAKVDAIEAVATGRRFALPPDPSTPLLLTLPAGQYRVTLTAGQGTTRRQESVTVTPGGLAALNLKFDGYGSADYIKEIGW